MRGFNLGNRTGLFGGTFDPVHTGHVEAAKAFLESGLIHELWILPSPEPPHKQVARHTSFSHRYQMLNLVFNGCENIFVKNIENNLPRPSYTVRTLEYLLEENPDHTFYLCMGEDSLVGFSSWQRFRDILSMVSLIAVKRPGTTAGTVSDEILEKTLLLDNTPIEMSSSDYRKNNQSEDLPEVVNTYIEKHGLYL